MLNLAEYRQRPSAGGRLAALGRADRAWRRAEQGWLLPAHGAVSGARPRQRDAGRADFHVGAAEQRAAPPGLGPGAVHRSRAPAPANYPQSEFPEPLSWLEDEERRAAFDDSGNHFESGYHLTLVNLPAEESRARAAGLLYENRPTEGVDWRERLTAFVVETDRIFDLLDGVMPEIAWLDDSQTLTYLHATVSTRRYREGVPEVPFHLDALLADAPLIGGLAPMLGDQHVRVATVRGFPTSTWPGILDDLNRLGLRTAGVRAFFASTNPMRKKNSPACAVGGSPSARTSSRCCARRSSSRKALWSIPTPATRPAMPMPPCRSWAAIKWPSAT